MQNYDLAQELRSAYEVCQSEIVLHCAMCFPPVPLKIIDQSETSGSQISTQASTTRGSTGDLGEDTFFCQVPYFFLLHGFAQETRLYPSPLFLNFEQIFLSNFLHLRAGLELIITKYFGYLYACMRPLAMVGQSLS